MTFTLASVPPLMLKVGLNIFVSAVNCRKVILVNLGMLYIFKVKNYP